MKIIVIGGSGTIGNKVTSRLREKHDVVVAGRTSGDLNVDICDLNSIETMFEAVTELDAVVCIAGEAKWAPFESMSDADFNVGIRSKLMGQVNVVRAGCRHLNQNGSFTLTTGILADDPVVNVASPAMVNGAIHSFVRAVSLELGDGIRVNAVSAGLVEDSLERYRDYFPGHNAIPMNKVVNAYVKAVEGRMTGQVITVYDNR
jgi:NAD(P)-dependent dehydrogenase (short-subunit alcohol dehydrogenase family)